MRKMKDSGIEWIGEIPEYWECTQFKTLLSRNDGGVWGNDPTDTDVDKIVIRSTEQTIDGKWCINNPAKRDLTTENIKDYRIVKNDLLMTKSSGSLDHIGKTSIADEYFTKNECYYSNFIQRLRCYENKYFPKYAWFILNSTIARKQFAYLQNSTSGLGNINSGIINQIKVPLPPLPDQQQIADFLDDKVSQIDSVISKTRETIEEYKKLKQSIITEVVTGKVKIENGKVCGKYGTYKDSGIEWIGEIPCEWEVKRLKFSSKVRNEKYSENYGVLEYFGLENIESHSAKFIETENIYDITQSQICKKDDIVFGKLRPYLAKVYEVPIDECCSSEFAVFYNFEGYNKFFKYLFLSYWFITIVDASTYGTKMPRANIDFIKNMIIPLPDFESQYKIADFLDKKCSEIDKLITKKEQLVVELESYKKSLIYEVVTGKREV